MTKAILGGGISGLSAAFYLSKKFNNGIVLYEASGRLGGWIRTREAGNGAYFEQGARTLRFGSMTAASVLELIDEIGLSSSIKPAGKKLKNRYFYINNKLCNLPMTWKALFKKDPLFNETLLAPVLRDVFGKKKVVHDESVYDFISRRFGNNYADVLSAVICGIYAGNASEISVKSAMRPLFEIEQMYGSVCLGAIRKSLRSMLDSNPNKKAKSNAAQPSICSFSNGMESLPRALADYLKDKGTTEIHLNKKCRRIEFQGDEVLLDFDGKTEYAQHLYSSVPSNKLSELLSNEHIFLKEELSKIPFVSVAVVNLEYEGNVLPVEGFGFLVPPSQKLPILGVIFDSCIYSLENKTILTVMMGGRWFEQYLGLNPKTEDVLKIATDQLKKTLQVDAKPVNHVVSILRDCIPQYVVGHDDIVLQVNSYITDKKLPVTLIGNSYYGVGIPDAIISAKKGVEYMKH